MRISPPPSNAMDIFDSSTLKKTIDNVDLLDHPKTLRGMGGVPEDSSNDEG